MKQYKLFEKDKRLQDSSVVLLSVVVLLLSTILIRRLLFGLTCAAGIISIYLTVRRQRTQDASVVAGLWAALATAVYTGIVEIVIPTAIVCFLSYIVWNNYKNQ